MIRDFLRAFKSKVKNFFELGFAPIPPHPGFEEVTPVVVARSVPPPAGSIWQCPKCCRRFWIPGEQKPLCCPHCLVLFGKGFAMFRKKAGAR
jgi:hypothetical protein